MVCVCVRACVSRLKGKNFKYRPYVGESGQTVCVCVCVCVRARKRALTQIVAT
jgi:hypothetical protein